MSLKKILLVLAAMAVAGVAAFSTAAIAGTFQAAPVAGYCVTFGHGAGAAGNVVEYNWDGSQCPANTYPHAVGDNDVMGSVAPTPSVSPSDNDSGFLPATFFTANNNHTATTFTINDGGMMYSCQFGSPVESGITTTFIPSVTCTKTS